MNYSLYKHDSWCILAANKPTCVGERENIMNEQLLLFGPSAGVIHDAQSSFPPTQAADGPFLFKTCTRCKNRLPISEFYKRKNGIVNSECKSCTKVAVIERYHKDPDKTKQRVKEWRKNNPEKTKEHAANGRIKHSEKRKADSRARYYADVEKSRAKGRERFLKNKDRARATKNKWFEANKEKAKDNSKAWRERNKEKVKESVKQWFDKNPEKMVAYAQKRRAMKKNAKGYEYTKAHHIKARFEIWGGKCWICGKKAEHIDHVIPLCLGGSHWPANLRPACAKCNCSRPKDGSDLPTRNKK